MLNSKARLNLIFSILNGTLTKLSSPRHYLPVQRDKSDNRFVASEETDA